MWGRMKVAEGESESEVVGGVYRSGSSTEGARFGGGRKRVRSE